MGKLLFPKDFISSNCSLPRCSQSNEMALVAFGGETVGRVGRAILQTYFPGSRRKRVIVLVFLGYVSRFNYRATNGNINFLSLRLMELILDRQSVDGVMSANCRQRSNVLIFLLSYLDLSYGILNVNFFAHVFFIIQLQCINTKSYKKQKYTFVSMCCTRISIQLFVWFSHSGVMKYRCLLK